jgi:hypothetical protein
MIAADSMATFWPSTKSAADREMKVETVPYYSKMLMALAASVPTIFQDRAGTLRPEGLRATGSSNARPRWR